MTWKRKALFVGTLAAFTLLWISNIAVFRGHRGNHGFGLKEYDEILGGLQRYGRLTGGISRCHSFKDPSRLGNFSCLRTKSHYPIGSGKMYSMNNRDICAEATHIELLFLVHSSPENFEKRSSIRNTFANRTMFTLFNVRLIFLVGISEYAVFENKMADEHRKYGDVIQGNFLDTYKNLTLKVVTGFQWITRYCPNVSVVAKLDDDVFVDTIKFMKVYLPIMKLNKEYILCNPVGSIIMRNGKWKMSDTKVLRHYNTYPWRYCSGFGVFISGDMIGRLNKAATFSPFLWVDDVYFSGVLPSKLRGVKYKYIPNRWLASPENKQCLLRKNCTYIAAIVNQSDVRVIWDYFMSVRYLYEEF